MKLTNIVTITTTIPYNSEIGTMLWVYTVVCSKCNEVSESDSDYLLHHNERHDDLCPDSDGSKASIFSCEAKVNLN